MLGGRGLEGRSREDVGSGGGWEKVNKFLMEETGCFGEEVLGLREEAGVCLDPRT